MGWFSRTPKSDRSYPAAGVTVTGDAGRFRRAKTTGARRAAKAAEEWEAKDRATDRRGNTRITRW